MLLYEKGLALSGLFEREITEQEQKSSSIRPLKKRRMDGGTMVV